MTKSDISNSNNDDTPNTRDDMTPNSSLNFGTPQDSSPSGIKNNKIEPTEFISEMENIKQAALEKESLSKKRSRSGCVTCKLRKKRCDEVKPTCGDCSRLKRQCVYIDKSMSTEEAKVLKLKMEIVEGQSKARKRKPKDKSDKKIVSGETTNIQTDNKSPDELKKRRVGHKQVKFNPNDTLHNSTGYSSQQEFDLMQQQQQQQQPQQQQQQQPQHHHQQSHNIQRTQNHAHQQTQHHHHHHHHHSQLHNQHQTQQLQQQQQQQQQQQPHQQQYPIQQQQVLENDSNKVIFNPLSFDLMGAYSPNYTNFPNYHDLNDISGFAPTSSNDNTAIPNLGNVSMEKQGSSNGSNNNHRIINGSNNNNINNNVGLPSSNFTPSHGEFQRPPSQKHQMSTLEADFPNGSYPSAWENSSNLIPVLGNPNIVNKGRHMGRYGTPPVTLSSAHTDPYPGHTEEDDDRYTPLSEIFSPGFSKVFQEHLQALEEEEQPPPPASHDHPSGSGNTSLGNNAGSLDRKNSTGSIGSLLNRYEDVKKEVIDNLTEVFEFHPADRSQTATKVEELDDDNIPLDTSTTADIASASESLSVYERYLQRQQFNNPKIYINPSIVRSSPLASLPPIGIRLYEYYRDNLSHRISTLPNEQNNYLTTILPMAHIDYGVLYGVIALGAFHLGGGKMEKYGNYFLQNAIKHFQKNPVLEDEKNPDFYKDVVDDKLNIMDDSNNTSPFEELISISSSSPDDIKTVGINESNLETKSILSTLSHKDQSNIRLASYLILCAVEICRGDVSKWVKYLEYGAKLIENSGGLTNFNESKDEQFLVASYAYHDMQAATTMHKGGQDGLHFNFSKYEELWSQQTESGLDSLHGLSSKIFKIIAEINILAMQSRISLTKVGNSLSENYFVELNKDNSNEDSAFSSSEDEEVLKDNISVDNVVVDKKKRRRNSNNTANSEDNENDELSPLDTSEKNSGPIASSSEWLKNQVQNQTREEAEASNEYQTRYEALDEIMTQVNKLELRLNDVKPDESQLSNLSIRDIELQLTAFECFQLTAKIHLHQSIMKINSSSLSTQHLLAQLIRCLDILLGSPIESCLCFPMFIAGMNCISKKDRKTMKGRFNEFIKRYRWKNVLRAKIVMKEVWKKDSNGNKCVDWFEIVRKLGWDLSFA